MFELQRIILSLCVFGGMFVVTAMFYAMFAHRLAARPNPEHFHESTLVEFIWTAIPILILFGVAIPTTSTIWQ